MENAKKFNWKKILYNSDKSKSLLRREVKETDLDFTTYQKEVTVIE